MMHLSSAERARRCEGEGGECSTSYEAQDSQNAESRRPMVLMACLSRCSLSPTTAEICSHRQALRSSDTYQGLPPVPFEYKA